MADKIEILVDLQNYDYAKNRLDELLRIMNTLSRGIHIPVSMTNQSAIERTLNSIEGHLDKIEKDHSVNIKDESLQRVSEEIDTVNGQLENLNSLASDIAFNTDTTGLEKANTELESARDKAISLQDILSGIGGAFNTVGGIFSSIGSLFDFDFLGTIERTLTAYGTVLGTQGLGKGVSRYDTLATYPKYMELMGVSAEAAAYSQERINDAILGLPVGLDEASEEIRRFTMYLKDSDTAMDETADKATDLAIGLEKALVAGGANTAKQTTARYEIDRLLATGSLANSRQWQALLNGLGISTQYLQDVMGYGDLSRQEFISALSAKPDADRYISGQEFLEGIAKLADYKPLQEAVDIYTSTISSWISRINYAMYRGVANVLDAANVALGGDEKGISGWLKELRDGIDRVFLGIADWTKENPEVLSMFIDKVHDVIDRVKELNLGELALDIVENGGKLIDFLLDLSRIFPDEWIRNFIAFSVTWASPLGRIFQTIGGFFVTLAKIPANGGLLGRLLGGGLGRAGGGATISGVGTGLLGIFGAIGSIAAFGGVLAEYGKIVEYIGQLNVGKFSTNIVPVTEAFLSMSGLVTAVVGLMSVITAKGGAPFVLMGEGLTAGLEILIGSGGGLIYEFGKLAEYISSLNLTSYSANWKKVYGLFTAVGGMTATITGIISGISALGGGLGGVAVGAGELLTTGLLWEIDYSSRIIERFVDLAAKISESEMPSTAKMGRLKETLNQFATLTFDTSLVGTVEKVVGIFSNLSTLGTTMEDIGDLTIASDADEKIEKLIDTLVASQRAFQKDGGSDLTPGDASNYKVIIGHLKDALIAIGDAAGEYELLEGQMNWIFRTEGGFEELTGKITQFASGLGDIFTTIQEEFGVSLIARFESWNQEATLGHLTDSLGVLRDTFKNMEAIRVQIGTLDLGLSGKTHTTAHHVGQGYYRYDTDYENDPFQELVGQIKEMLHGVENFMDELGGNFVTAILKRWKTWFQKGTLKDIGEALGKINEIATNIDTVAESLSDVMGEHNKFATFKVNLHHFIKAFKDLISPGGFTDPDVISFDDSWDAGKFEGFFDNVSKGMQHIKDVIIPIVDIMNWVPVILKQDTLKDVGTIFTHLKIAVAKIANGESGGETMVQNAEYAKEAVTSVKSIISDLAGMQEQITTLSSGETDIGTQVGTILEGMFTAMQVANTEEFQTTMGELQTLVSGINEVFDTLQNTDISNLNEELSEMSGTLSGSLNGELKTFADRLDEAQRNANYLSSNIAGIATAMAMQMGAMGGFVGTLSSLSNSLRITATDAYNLASAIAHIPTNVNVRVGTEGGIGRRGTFSLNRAHGGIIPGSPVGTDTIPAWLSPGEFIMRAKAVRTFGEAFMQNVNQLNIAGAINSLAKQYAFNTPNAASYVNNYDNHASVNQTIITNNADYSYKRASRFVRALH